MTQTTTDGGILACIEADVAALPEREGITIDDVCNLKLMAKSVIRRAKEAENMLDAFLIQWMPANNIPEIVVGDEVTFVANKKKVKDKNVGATVRGLLEAAGGDEDQFLDCLSSNAVKQGAAKKLLGDRFDDFFETTFELDVQSKPVKQLVTVNTKFLKR